MNEDLPSTQRSRRADAREKLAARRQRARAIRRRVAGMSLAAFLAAGGAVLIQLVTGHDPALGRPTHQTTTVAFAAHSGATSRQPGTESGSSDSATSPSAVTTSAS